LLGHASFGKTADTFPGSACCSVALLSGKPLTLFPEALSATRAATSSLGPRLPRLVRYANLVTRAEANMTRTRSPHYTVVAIALHWLTALAVMTLLAAGLWMTDAIQQPDTKAVAFKVYQWHKSLGLTVMVLTVLRIIWRVMNPPPPLPSDMTPFERTAASLTHAAFYTLLLAIPLAGWAMVSASPFGLPTMVFGLFEWPHITPLTGVEDKKAVEAVFKFAHKIMGFGLIVLLALHIAAALKHHLVDHDDVLTRMLPGASRRPKSTRPSP
jgi:cytochrome b561